MKNKTPQTTQQIIDSINNLNISSERLSLKKFTEAEVEFNVAHEMDPDLMRYIRDVTTSAIMSHSTS